MKKYINRLILAAATILLGAGSAMAQDVLTIEGSVKNATVAVYKADAQPTSAPSGPTATTIAPGEWIILNVTPTSGYWTYDGILTIQPAGSIGGAEARPHRAIMVPVHPTALSGNEADGTGCYYLQIPANWKNADGYIKVIIGGEAIEKINLSSATLSGTTVTTADRADGWKATITLDEVSWTYDKNAHCPAISTFTLTNGTKSFTNTTAQVAISGAQTNAGNHNATLSAVTGGCFVNSKSVSFSIAKAATAITLNTPPGGGEVGQMDVGDTYTSGATLSPTNAGSLTISLSKESVVTVDADGVITAVGEGEVTITFSFSGNENYAAAESKTMKIQVSKVPTEITVAPANPEWGDTWQLKVLDECATGATLTPAEAGILSYSSSDESVAKVVDGKIKAFAEGTATITVSFAGNTKYAAAESKTIAVNVSLNDASVSVDKENVELLVDETHTIIPTTTPVGLTVTYTPDASGVVSVDASGKVTALKEGNATVTVSVGGDGVNKYNAVTVNVHVTKVLNEDDIVLTIPTDGYTYDATAKEPAVTVKVGDKTLVQGTDYNVSYSNNVNAGENTATVTVTDIDGGDYNVSGTKKFSIAKAPLTITAQDQEYVYNGYPQGEGDVVYADPAEFATKVSVTGLQGTDALFSFILNGTKTEVGDYASAIELSSVVIKKGDTDVTANYDFTLVAGKLTITQKEVGLTWGTASFNYDGNSHAPSATVTGLVNSDDVSATVAISANSGSSLTDGKAVNVGSYTATVTKLTGTKADNYKLPATGLTQTFNINASDAASAVVTANDLTYNGTAQDLVTIGAITNGATGTAADVVFYESATSTTPLAGIPQGTDAGTYEVYYEVTPDGDHTAPDRTKVTVTIAPVKVSVTITGHNNTSVYDGNEHSVNGYVVEKDNTLYKESDFTFSGTATAKRIETGMTMMGLKADQFTNTNTNFIVTFNVTDGYQTITSITNVVVMITGQSNTSDYDGKEHTVTGYEVKSSNPLYTEADFTFSGTATAARTNKGTTYMGLTKEQFTNTSTTNFETVTFIVTDGYQTISPIKADVTITGRYNTTAYDEKEHTVTGYVASFSNDLYKESDFTFSGTAKATRTDEGTTYMGLKEEQFANINENFDPVTFTVIDGYQTISAVTDVVVTITGQSNTADYDGKEHTVTGYNVEISNPLYTEADFTFSGTALAVRTDAGTTNMGLTKEQFTNTNSDFANVTFNVTDGYQTIKPIAATVTINGNNNVALYDGTPHTVTGYVSSFSNDLYKQADFTFSGTASAAQTVKGTTNMGLKADQFTNTNANFDPVTFNVIDGYQTIIPAPLTITADNKRREVGEENPELTVTYSGFVNNETPDVLTTKPTVTTTATAESTAGDYPITVSGATADNYDITFLDGTLTIIEKGTTITIDGSGCGIRVVRNDTRVEVPNVATLTYINDRTSLCIDKVEIAKLDDATTEKPIGVTVYIPATLKDNDKNELPTYGVGSDIIVTDASVPVTDIYMPNTEEIIDVAKQAFRLTADESTTAIIHTSLPLLDDYALTAGLKAEYEDGHVMTTITPTTQLWTLSTGVDIVVPEGVTAYICKADGLDAVAATAITSTKANVNGQERVIVKANNGVMMEGENSDGGTFDLFAWPSADRPSGTKPTTEDAKTYEGNMLVPATVKTHFEPSECYILYNNTFHELESDDDTSVSPCKAVLRKGNPAMARNLDIHKDTNGIHSIYVDSLSEEGKWYSLDGRRLNGKPSAKGLYIHNGKKVVIK